MKILFPSEDELDDVIDEYEDRNKVMNIIQKSLITSRQKR